MNEGPSYPGKMREEVEGGYSSQRKTHAKALRKEGAEAVGITEQSGGGRHPGSRERRVERRDFSAKPRSRKVILDHVTDFGH